MKRKTPYNSTFAIGVVSSSEGSFEVNKSSVLRMKIRAEKPAHRKSANRYMPFKKAYILTILFCCFIRLTNGQENGTSKHNFSFYKNNQKHIVSDCELSITIDGTRIVASRSDNVFTFPTIDTSKSFTITIKTNDITFTAGPYKAWYLNNGSRMVFGSLRKINKLLSVAEYNDLTEKDENWDVFSKRFFIVDKAYTIDIDDFKKVRELEYFIINPRQEGDGSYSLTQKATRLRR